MQGANTEAVSWWRPYVGGALLGLAVAAFVILAVREVALAPPPLDIQLPTPVAAPAEVTVHIGGAVAEPGVYKAPTGSRLHDAIGLAGGVTTMADPDAANLAATLDDGGSYVIPVRESPPDIVIVHVDGAVNEPGIYELPLGARVNDAIKVAGGLTKEADLSEHNPAAPLVDGGRYHVPAREAPPRLNVTFHLAGAVVNQGVYTLPLGSRMRDAVELAGGVLGNADVNAVDLARVLSDGERYYIPTKGETAVVNMLVHIVGAVQEPGLYTLPAGSRLIDAIDLAGGPLPTADMHALNLAQRLLDGERYPVPTARRTININIATVDDLDAIPGVSRAIALAIVNHRETSGIYSAIDDLLDVSGIGPVTLAAIRPHVSVG